MPLCFAQDLQIKLPLVSYSMSGSPTHKTAAWLVKLLKSVKDFFPRYTLSLKDSFEFVDMIRDHNLKEYMITSLDVISLFISLRVKEILIQFLPSFLSLILPWYNFFCFNLYEHIVVY